MLKSLLFSLTLMLCLTCGSPLTQAAEDVRPEKPAPAESQTNTEDRYKALLQRLDTIESKLETEKQTKQHIDAALKEFDAKTQGQVSMLSTGFTALGAMAAFLSLFSFIITVLTIAMHRSSLKQIQQDAQKTRKKLKSKAKITRQQLEKSADATRQKLVRDAEEIQNELKNIIEEARKHRKTLREMTADLLPEKKFPAPVLAQAENAAAQGVGTDVLWGNAILAQEEERWQEALTYWQGVLKQSPQDRTALFGASLAALQLSEKATGEERQNLWQTAENYFKAFPKEQLTVAVLHNWGLLCQNRGEVATDSNERERWFNKAEEKYRKATEANPHDADSWNNWGNLCLLRGNATTDNIVRENWYNNAEEKYRKATEANPHDAGSWYNWGLLYQNRSEAATDSKERERWYNEATEKYRKAIEADPNHANSWGNWGNICLLRGNTANDNRVRDDWYDKAEEKFRKATEAYPNHATNWYNWSVLCMFQGKAASDADTREHWYAEADKNLTKALDIAPRYASAWFNKACLASLRQDVNACVDALEQWHTYDSNASAAKLDNDSDFDNVRHTPEFQEFRKKLADNK